MARRPRLLAAVLVVVIAGLIASALWIAFGRRDAGEHPPDPATEAVVTELEAFVESARGLRFVAPVDVSVLGDRAFRRALSDGDPLQDQYGDAVEAGVLRALGLVKPGQDLGGADTTDPETVAGFYDTDTKKLVVRGGTLTPFVRQVLVHELTHALDDQHFDLDPDLEDDEAALAFDALVEGDAMNVEMRYVDSLPEDQRRQAHAEEDAIYGAVDTAGVPDVLLDLGDFPYTEGPVLVAALLAAGGTARLDAAFGAPPTTSAEVLHPERFLAGRGRAPVPEVDAGGRVVDDGVLGEFLLDRILAESTSPEEADRDAAGWAGDRYVAWRSGKRTCLRATIVTDSEAEAAELTAGLRRWAGDHAGATVEPAGAAVSFSRCA